TLSTLTPEVDAVHIVMLWGVTADRTVEDRPQQQRRRPRGAVRDGLVSAGLELARSGGPDAVVLREATRIVGVVPNAAYRHFADRNALLAAVCAAAMRDLGDQMATGVPTSRAHTAIPPQLAAGCMR